MTHQGFACVGLSHAKNPHNIGSVLRAAGCFDVALVAVQGHQYKRASTDTSNAYQNLPFVQCDDLHAVIPYDCVPVAVELVDGATPLPDYVHPPRAFYVFGPEDGSLGKSVLRWCRDVVSIPTNGCLNLAAAVNVVLYDRATKQSRPRTGR